MATNNVINVGTGTSGQVLTSNGPGVAPTFQAAAAGGITMGYRSGQYYAMPINAAAAAATFVTAAGTIYLTLCYVNSNVTINEMSFEVQAASGGGTSGRIGIYNIGADGFPTTVFLNAGTATTDTNAVRTVATSKAITPGLYWVAMQFESTPTVYRYNTSAGAVFSIGQGTSFARTSNFSYSTPVAYASSLTDLTSATFTAISQVIVTNFKVA